MELARFFFSFFFLFFFLAVNELIIDKVQNIFDLMAETFRFHKIFLKEKN